MDALLSPQRRQFTAALGRLGALGASGALLAGCGARPDPGSDRGWHFRGNTMGSIYRLTLADDELRRRDAERAHAAVVAALDRVDRDMSLFRPDAELARLNRHPADRPLPVSPELFEVLAAGQRAAQLTQGAFDVTVAPLVQSWGFGADRRRGVPPGAALDARRQAVGYRRLHLHAATGTAVKEAAALQVDLGGIAKGYAVDRAARALDALGFDRYLIEAGGEVRVRGANAHGVPWRVGIERPDAVPQRAAFVLPLSGGAVATSGDYRNYFVHEGRRYSHAIDPARAAPIDHPLCSVTVVDGECMRADALATGLIVLGVARGFALARQLGLAALFIERGDDGGLRPRATDAFLRLGGWPA
jgi:thiamine biosynthesis lipoprotein